MTMWTKTWKHGELCLRVMKISKTKIEYLPSPTNDTETTVKIVDAELPTVTSFKFIGSLNVNEGGSQADVNKMIRICY